MKHKPFSSVSVAQTLVAIIATARATGDKDFFMFRSSVVLPHGNRDYTYQRNI
jgi:hypothetical protein